MINAISTFALHSMGVVGSFGDVAVNSEANCQQTGMIREGVLYLKGHSQLVHMRIRYHFLADWHITLHRKSRAEKRIL